MTKVGLKELRQNVDKYLALVKKGEELIVTRKSELLFKISPLENDPWEEVIDFTKIQKGGVNIDDILERL
jgi:antitoxin (DNA-binding transcriptional repressor) of toxin-antitoxin stability system